MASERLQRLLREARAKRASEQQQPIVSAPSQQILTKTMGEISSVVAHQKPTGSGIKIRLGGKKQEPVLEEQPKEIEPPVDAMTHTNRYGETIIYNENQQRFVSLASTGKHCILIGAAGTGKTTCMQGTVENLVQSGAAGVLQGGSHKYLPSGTPGVVVVSYTRRAVNNIKLSMPDDMKANCITVHKLLEYQPVFYEYYDEETETMKKSMSFEPSRNAMHPLPSSIRTIIVEESSMLSLDLYAKLIDALAHDVQWILLGDINQLPPVFGSAILGYKLLQWEVIELTEVYRQALESPIIRLAHRILSGKPIKVEEFENFHVKHELTLHPWKKKLSDENAVRTLAAFFTRAMDNNVYDPENDMILLPFNKACGTIELNKYIANHIARKYERVTWEVLAGFNKHYFSVGDKVMYDREDAEIVAIAKNGSYSGGRVQQESKTLDYWGYNKNQMQDRLESQKVTLDEIDIEAMLEEAASAEDRVRQASHVLTLRMLETEVEISISSAAEVNSLIHGYAITVHKAQGSEWDKVFLCLHQSHATMIQRELMYTAVTRAKRELYVICEPDSFTKGIERQKIKGNTLEAKAEHFKGKLDNIDEELLPYIYRG